MTHTAKRIEILRLLKEVQLHNESPGDTIIRALQALRDLPDVELIRDEWCVEYVALRDRLSPTPSHDRKATP